MHMEERKQNILKTYHKHVFCTILDIIIIHVVIKLYSASQKKKKLIVQKQWGGSLKKYVQNNLWL